MDKLHKLKIKTLIMDRMILEWIFVSRNIFTPIYPFYCTLYTNTYKLGSKYKMRAKFNFIFSLQCIYQIIIFNPALEARPNPSSSQEARRGRTPCWPAYSRQSSWGRPGPGPP